MIAKHLKLNNALNTVPKRPRGNFGFAGALRRMLAVCAVAASLTAYGCSNALPTPPNPIAITITSPSTPPTIEQGQSVNLAASVVNDATNQGASWSVTGVGSIPTSTTTTATYLAPAAVTLQTTVVVTAHAIANPGIEAQLSIHVTPPITVLVLPSNVPVPANGGRQGFNATVSSDQNGAGVSWSLSGANCSGATCGTLSNPTATSVQYQAPPAQPAPNNNVILTATSVADKAQFSTATITVTPSAPITVTIPNKIASVVAGGGPALFSATVQNDPASSGVNWTLMAGGSSCAPTCGTLSGASANTVSPSSVTYTPPATVPAAPNNQPTLVATSTSVPAGSDSDAFIIEPIANPCAGSPSGHESLLNKQYAIWLQGWQGALSGTGTPVAMAASFAADGAGHVTGGELDINGTNGPQHYVINAASSSYIVGAHPPPADSGNHACLTIATTSGPTITFQMALGATNPGNGRVIEFDDSSGTGTVAAGLLRIQDTTSFFANKLQPNYAFGLDGADSKGGPVSIAGSFAASTTGSISNGNADINDAGTVSGALNGGVGAITGLTANGRGTATFSIGAGHAYTWAIYMVNANEFFIVETDALSSSQLTSGRALATASSFTSSLLSGNYIFHQSGIATCNANPCARVSLAWVNFGTILNNNNQPTANAPQINQYDRSSGLNNSSNLGSPPPPITLATYSAGGSSGRVAFSEPNPPVGLVLPVLYLVSPPVDGVSAFIVGQDSTAAFGLAEFQPNQTYTSNSLAGNYVLGTEDPRDNFVPNAVGTVVIGASGNASGTEDRSGHIGLIGGQVLGGSVTILAPANASGQSGTGFIFSNTFVAITNGTKIFYIDTSTAQITVIELQ